MDGLDDHDHENDVEDQIAQHAVAREWLHAQPAKARADLARELLLSLPNAVISQIVCEANQRLHFDPVVCLPQEIITHIFQLLEPHSLVSAAAVSKAWESRAFDPSLWKRLFLLEGWPINKRNAQRFGDLLRQRSSARKGKLRLRPDGVASEEPAHKRLRETPSGPMGSLEEMSSLPSGWSRQSELVEADGEGPETHVEAGLSDHHMHSASLQHKDTSILPRPSHNIVATPELDLVYETVQAEPRLDWREVYKQRRRLEANWDAGRHTNFCLPHPDHPEEAHSQCVYTLQYSATHLVSGGRDKTVRVWDLETQRLKLPPLTGHDGSVLCLQFDDQEGQDVIISGGSDSDIIVWKLSTGELLRRLSHIHTEPVLSLRFDNRYLVTCSKDKTIKVLNRRDLLPTDPEYPRKCVGAEARYPDYIFNLDNHENFLDSRFFQPLACYSILMTFEGHKAAVNAIQIHNNEIISASGDRTCMLWNMTTGSHIKTFGGHSKGIACVQYDGRRIVSGSSDFSVRVFDRETGAELNVLEGHRDLVRTVQAHFSDVPGDEDEARAQAREHDLRMLEERVRRQQTSAAWTPMLRQKHFVTGAKLPPGGGGNRWSKIVSGSYDENVIVWRKDRQGHWFASKVLRQDSALRAATAAVRPVESSVVGHEESAGPPSRLMREWAPFAGVQRAPQQADVTSAHNAAGTADPASFTDMAPQPRSPRQVPAQSSGRLASTQAQSLAPGVPTTAPQLPTRNAQSSQAHASQPPSTAAADATPAHLHPQHPHFQPPLQGPNLHGPQAHDQQPGGPNSRVFKVQFDARRIVCCSQEPVIVGWDFANGDKDIIAASRFFGEPVP